MGTLNGLPDFVVIGAMKTGTTTLHQYLRNHSGVHVPADKELNFFVAEHNWHRGVDWYRDQFRRAPARALLGEVSPDYSKYPRYPGVPERMASVLPDVRLVYLVREPIARIRSEYRHQVGAGREERPIEVAVIEDLRYLDASRYATQLDQYMEHFSRDQMLVVLSEELRARPRETMGRLFEFLGRPPLDNLPGEEWNRSDQIGRRRWLARVARRIPLAHELADRLPNRLAGRLRGLAYRPVDPDVSVLSTSVEQQLREMVRDEVARLAEWLPQAPRAWGFE